MEMGKRGVLWACLAMLNVSVCGAQMAGNTTYTYDPLGRLIGEGFEDGNGATYNYDAAGNRISAGSLSTLTIQSASVAENAGTVNVQIVRGGATSNAVSVQYVTQDGNDAANADHNAIAATNYTAKSGTVSFAVGQTTQTIAISVLDDHRFDSYQRTRIFQVVLSNPLPAAQATLATGSSTAVVTINESDPAPVFLISNATAAEGAAIVFTVSQPNPTGYQSTVAFATAPGTAVAGSNYTAPTPGTLTFAAGVSSQTFQVQTIHNGIYDGSLSFSASLNSPGIDSRSGGVATIAPGSATGTITEIDPAPVFSINSPAAVSEGGLITFTVTKANSTHLASSVNYATANGTAVAGTNYVSKSGPLSFPATTASQTFTVTTIDDHVVTAAKTFTANLSGAVAATIGTAGGTGTINDADGAVPATPTLSPATQYTTTGNFTLTWSLVGGATSYQLVLGATQVYSGTATSYVGSKNSGDYYYQVRACNAYGCSAYSNQAEVLVCRGGVCN